jgi:sugar lactone lactonase YvrE
MNAAPASTMTCVLDARASLGECAIWSTRDDALCWVDIRAPAFHRFDPATGRNLTAAMPCAIGCFAVRARGGYVAALRDGIWLLGANGEPERRMIDAPYDTATHRFNDGRCDPRGRLIVGTMNEAKDGPTAKVYRVDPDFTLHELFGGITIANGLAWSPDGRTMYHADTETRTVHAFDYDLDTGTPRNPRVFVRWSGATERPDGAATDSVGNYWVAFYGGGKVVQVSPHGQVLAEHPLPAMCPTMPAFGGPQLRTLYVTTARQQRPAEELAQLPESGGIFSKGVDVAGLPEPRFAG